MRLLASLCWYSHLLDYISHVCWHITIVSRINPVRCMLLLCSFHIFSLSQTCCEMFKHACIHSFCAARLDHYWCFCGFHRPHWEIHSDRKMAGHRTSPSSSRESRGFFKHLGSVCRWCPADPASHRSLPDRTPPFRRAAPQGPWTGVASTEPPAPCKASPPQRSFPPPPRAPPQVPHFYRCPQRPQGDTERGPDRRGWSKTKTAPRKWRKFPPPGTSRRNSVPWPVGVSYGGFGQTGQSAEGDAGRAGEKAADVRGRAPSLGGRESWARWEKHRRAGRGKVDGGDPEAGETPEEEWGGDGGGGVLGHRAADWARKWAAAGGATAGAERTSAGMRTWHWSKAGNGTGVLRLCCEESEAWFSSQRLRQHVSPYVPIRVWRQVWRSSGCSESVRKRSGSARQRRGLRSSGSRQNWNPRRDRLSSWRAAAGLWTGRSDRATRNYRWAVHVVRSCMTCMTLAPRGCHIFTLNSTRWTVESDNVFARCIWCPGDVVKQVYVKKRIIQVLSLLLLPIYRVSSRLTLVFRWRTCSMSWSCWPRSWDRWTCSSLSSRPAPRSRCCQPSLERKRAAATVREKVPSVLFLSQMNGLNKTENTKCSSFYPVLSLRWFLFVVTLGFYSNFKDSEVQAELSRVWQYSYPQERDFFFFICRLNVSPLIKSSSSIKPLFLSHTAINLLREPDSPGECQQKKLCQRKLIMGWGSGGYRMRFSSHPVEWRVSANGDRLSWS